MITNGRLVFFEQPVDELPILALVSGTACLLRGNETSRVAGLPDILTLGPPGFFQKEFDVSEMNGGKLSPSHERSAQGRIRLSHDEGADFAPNVFLERQFVWSSG